MGLGSARVTLEALTPRHPGFVQVHQWLNETTRLEPTPAGMAYIQGRKADAEEQVRSAQQKWSEYSEADKALRTLRAEDGT